MSVFDKLFKNDSEPLVQDAAAQNSAAQPAGTAFAAATLGGRIAALRKAAGLTQEQLANQLGVTFQAVSKWENDISCPDVLMLPTLADIFAITLDGLFGRVDETAAQGAAGGAAVYAAMQDLPWPDDNSVWVAVYQGHRLLDDIEAQRAMKGRELQVRLVGDVGMVNAAVSVTVEGDVQGPLNAGDSAKVGGSVGGALNAGDGVQVGGNVHGGIHAGDGVQVGGNVKGDVAAGDGVTIGGAVQGSVTAGDSVRCGPVAGSVQAEDSVTVNGDVGGNVWAGDNVRCNNVIGTADAGEGVFTGGAARPFGGSHKDLDRLIDEAIQKAIHDFDAPDIPDIPDIPDVPDVADTPDIPDPPAGSVAPDAPRSDR